MGHGRPKGVPNKTSGLLKEAILKAAGLTGHDKKGKQGLVGYCRFLAENEPKAFAGLLGKVLPTQVTGEDGKALTVIIQGTDASLI
jgi:hypothetical protein